jgi:uncharacterized membrane protein (DUF106 family)
MTEEDKKENILPENKEGESPVPLTAPAIPSDKKAKEGSFMPLILIMVASMLIAFYWNKLPWISKSIHVVFDPTAGALLDWNLNLGMIIIVLVITLLTTLVQKYATDQKTLKELRKEQKEIQKQMKEFKNHPEKLMELQKKQFAMMPKQMKLSMRAIAYTGIPFILFFRWFNDYFIAAGNPKFILGLGWFLFYLIFAIIFGTILRKYLDVV